MADADGNEGLAPLEFVTVFDPAYGRAVPVAEKILRITARNPGPFTFEGTNSYVVGDAAACVIVDPGPDLDQHLAAILAAVGDRKLAAILLTHTHRDHTGLVARLRDVTGAPLVGAGPHRLSRLPRPGEDASAEMAGETDLAFDRLLGDGEELVAGKTILRAIATPGHCANHLAFALGDTGTVLSGDHVMGWSTTIVAPPDGSMAAYMASLSALIERRDRLYLPGHGGAIDEPGPFLRALLAHRQMRERAILDRLSKGDRTAEEIVGALYRSTPEILRGAAALSVFAHLEHLVERGLVAADGPPVRTARYEIAGDRRQAWDTAEASVGRN